METRRYKELTNSFGKRCPDASVDIDAVVADIEAIRDVGGGGIAFLPYYNFGFSNDPTRVPFSAWDEYAFGSDAFKELFHAALNASEQNGLAFDFFLGANQGQGVPAKPLTKGLAEHLVYGKTTVARGETFEGRLPEDDPEDLNFDESVIADFMHPHEDFGPRKLVGVVAAGVVSRTPSDDKGRVTVSIDESSLLDLTDHVVDGQLTWDAPSDYQNYTLLPFTRDTPTSDHFSAAGADLAINYWEENLLDPAIRQLLREVGEHTFEDSMEISAGLFWSEDLLERFKKRNAYSPIRYLPILFNATHSYRREYPPYDETFVLSGDEFPEDNGYLQDYRDALTNGYKEYLAALEDWAQTLGLTHSAQPAYHLPLDMSASTPIIGGPELESLAFPSIDHSLQFVGPVHLQGHNLISSEVGAIFNAYSFTVPGLVHLFKTAYAASVNAMVVHGMAYGGGYVNTTWPGFAIVQYFTGEVWNTRLPAWNYMDDAMGFAARTQVVLQRGVFKRDVAFYLYKEPWTATEEYEGSDLRNAGFSYEYLGPANLASEEAVVEDGVLAPEGPAYRALVFDNQIYISPEAAKHVLRLAKEGLPIVIIGNAPNTTIGTAGQHEVSRSMDSLPPLTNVKFIDGSDSLVETLAALDVQPRVSVAKESAASGLWSVWRETDDADFVYLFNDNETQTFNLTFEVADNKIPYQLDAWTGDQNPWKVYERTEAGISLSVTLVANQSTIFGFAEHCGPEDVHVTDHSENVEKVLAGQGKGLIAFVNDSAAATVALQDGSRVDLAASNSVQEIGELLWNLTLESWVPSEDPSITRSVIDTIPLGVQDTLQPWSAIDGVQNVSGVGIYTTILPLPSDFDAQDTAILIHFGPILGTLRAWVNDDRIPPVDISHAEADISKFLKPGENSIRVEVSSNLFNVVKARIHSIRTGGDGVMPGTVGEYEDGDWQEHGLVGPATTRVLRKVVVEP
ncbi:hypothetical protein ACJZ2D_011007 [Fusarium nematophilum]